MPVREGTDNLSLAVSILVSQERRVASCFPCSIYPPSAATWYQFAAGRTVSEDPTYGLKRVSNHGPSAQQTSGLATWPLAHHLQFHNIVLILNHKKIDTFPINEKERDEK